MKLSDRDWAWMALIATIIGGAIVGVFGEGIFWFAILAGILLLGLLGGSDDK